MAFVHYTVKKIVHGLGAIKEAANEVKNLKGSKAFIVTDPGLAKIGVQKPLEEALTAGGVEWKLYAEAQSGTQHGFHSALHRRSQGFRR